MSSTGAMNSKSKAENDDESYAESLKMNTLPVDALIQVFPETQSSVSVPLEKDEENWLQLPLKSSPESLSNHQFCIEAACIDDKKRLLFKDWGQQKESETESSPGTAIQFFLAKQGEDWKDVENRHLLKRRKSYSLRENEHIGFYSCDKNDGKTIRYVWKVKSSPNWSEEISDELSLFTQEDCSIHSEHSFLTQRSTPPTQRTASSSENENSSNHLEDQLHPSQNHVPEVVEETLTTSFSPLEVLSNIVQVRADKSKGTILLDSICENLRKLKLSLQKSREQHDHVEDTFSINSEDVSLNVEEPLNAATEYQDDELDANLELLTMFEELQMQKNELVGMLWQTKINMEFQGHELTEVKEKFASERSVFESKLQQYEEELAQCRKDKEELKLQLQALNVQHQDDLEKAKSDRDETEKTLQETKINMELQGHELTEVKEKFASERSVFESKLQQYEEELAQCRKDKEELKLLLQALNEQHQDDLEKAKSDRDETEKTLQATVAHLGRSKQKRADQRHEALQNIENDADLPSERVPHEMNHSPSREGDAVTEARENKKNQSVRRRTLRGKSGIRILLSGFDETEKPSVKEWAESIDAKVLEAEPDARRATHVVMNRTRMSYTAKVMIAMCFTPKIVKVDWLRKSSEDGKEAPWQDYKLLDEKVVQNIESNLKENVKVLDGMKIYVDPKVTAKAKKKTKKSPVPPLEELKAMIQAAGGNVVRRPPGRDNESVTTVSSQNIDYLLETFKTQELHPELKK